MEIKLTIHHNDGTTQVLNMGEVAYNNFVNTPIPGKSNLSKRDIIFHHLKDVAEYLGGNGVKFEFDLLK